MKRLQKGLSATLALCVAMGVMPSVSAVAAENEENIHVIRLSSAQNEAGGYTHTATLDGEAVKEYDYTWSANPDVVYGEVKNAPSEHYSGTEPSGEEAVYIAHDIYYYPELDADKFVKINYDGDQEWAYYYTVEGYTDYIFGTLPVSGNSVPTEMMHSAEEAYENAVLHITEAGTYRLEGEWHGQIWIDLGDTDDTFGDETAKVKLILNGVNVTCTVAPALVFYSVYECDNAWEDRESYSATVDTSDAGAVVVLADGTVNNFEGTNIYRMLKTTYKKDGTTQKKMRKIDAAFYSYVTMNIDGGEIGDGVLNITSGFEGLDTELHLTINGGNVNIFAQDDGINVNEDGVSVVTFNGGSTHILAGLGSEGDGVDSNGFLMINGGTVISIANPRSDSGLDSDSGSFIHGGTVVALGSTMDWAEADDSSDSQHVTMNLRFSASQSADEAIIITDTDGNVVFAYDPDKDEVAGDNARWYQGAVISTDTLEVGKSYYVYVGGDVYGTETMGVYDVSTVTGFSDDAKQQGYTGTDDLGGFGGFGGMGGGMNRPNGFEFTTLPGGGDSFQLPENMDTTQIKEKLEGLLPEGTDVSQIIDAFFSNGGLKGNNQQVQPENGGQMPQIIPEGSELLNGNQVPDRGEGAEQTGDPNTRGDKAQLGGMGGFDRGDRWNMTGGMGGTLTSENAEAVFTMTATVNSFSGVGDYTEVKTVARFSDVAENDWYYEAAQYVSEKGLMQGTSAETFSPAATVTRGTVATILARMDGVDTDSGTVWYQNGMTWANEKGITAETDGAAELTREELATMLYGYAKLKGEGFTGAYSTRLTYTDLDTLSESALEAVQWCTMKGVLTGREDGTLNPKGTANRAELATVLMRFCALLEN